MRTREPQLSSRTYTGLGERRHTRRIDEESSGQIFWDWNFIRGRYCNDGVINKTQVFYFKRKICVIKKT